ncbi:MAG: hypothetical protein H7X97_09650 [Opitutaceae bacterium]|nr:hypothetical protein [Verrucomicrobiales bacterium]
MNDQPRSGNPSPEVDKGRPQVKITPITPAGQAPSEHEAGPTTGRPAAAKELTAEEQMALYEKDLKENDWGHQPC